MKQRLDHPLTFALAMILVITAGQRLFGAAAKKMGWGGISTFFNGK